MARCTYWTLVLIVMTISFFVVTQAQTPNANQSDRHSGIDEGRNGPKSPTPALPARASSNPENPDADAGKLQTLTGVVSDSFCGRNHYQLSGATPTECTRYCIAHRGTYSLVVGDRVYALQNRPGHTLDALAGQRATIKGAVNGSVIQIQSAGPAGKQ